MEVFQNKSEMKLIGILLPWLFFMTLPISSTFAHLCDDIFREPDRLVVKPERQIVRLEKTGSLGIYMKNTYPAPLHNVRLIGESSAFDVEVEPAIIEVLNPEEKMYLLIKLTLKEGIEPGSYPLVIKVGAKQFDFRQAMQIDIRKEEELKKETEEIMEKVVEPPTQPIEKVVVPEKLPPTEPEPVGEVMIRVERFAEQKYYFWLLPILFFVIILIYRKFKKR